MDVQNAEHDLKNYMNDHVILLTSIDQPNSTLKQSPAASAIAEPTLHTPSRTKTLHRLAFSKPKSRFSEPTTILFPLKSTATIFKDPEELQPYPPSEPTSSSSSSDDEDDDEWLDDDENEEQRKHWRWRGNNKVNKRATVEWALFLAITICLVCSLTIEPLADRAILGLRLWKWCVMVQVVFCGRLVSGWAVALLIFLIEPNFMLQEKVLYFMYGLWRSFQNCAWLGLVLIAWVIMFPHVRGGDYQVVRWAFRAVVVATFWLVKIVLVKVLASSFHTFFDRVKLSVFHHWCSTRSPARHWRKRRGRRCFGTACSNPLMVMWSERFRSKKIDMEKLKKLSMERRPSAWTVKRLVNYVRFSSLSTISHTVDNFAKAESSEINSEREARSCAHKIFKNVANPCTK
ncbi:hypothetical protein NL676_009247 [Syzygium grande]|nr:hypothetical protein NL676_009247 [Syzygium grande]